MAAVLSGATLLRGFHVSGEYNAILEPLIRNGVDWVTPITPLITGKYNWTWNQVCFTFYTAAGVTACIAIGSRLWKAIMIVRRILSGAVQCT